MKRRTLLATVGAATSATSLAGCTQLSSGLQGCDSMQRTTIDTAPVSLDDEQIDHLSPLVYAELGTDHQQVVDEARGPERFESCPPQPEPVESFVDLARERIDQQWTEYGEGPADRPGYLGSAYLYREGAYVELQIVVEDVVVSG